MEQTIQNYIDAINTNIARYEAQNESELVQSAQKMVADLTEMLETEKRETVYRNWWQNVYDNDQQDLY